MKLNTKLLILASACLVALSFAACGNDPGAEKNTDAPKETDVTEMTDRAPDSATNEADETGKASSSETEENTVDEALSDSVTNPGEEIPLDTTGASEETKEVVGPTPPPPETEAPTEAPTEPSVPDFGDAETNEDGVIELPFVPFPDAND